MTRYIELRDVFCLMNHKDIQGNFTREIDIFNNMIKRLAEIQQYNTATSFQEGGHMEY